MKNKWLTTAATVFICSLCVPALAQQDGDWSWSLGFDYSEGDYGDSTDTEILYIPFTARYDTGPWTYRFTLPYVSITGPGNVIPDIGAIGGRTATTRRTTESGIGDFVASATYNLMPGGGTAPIVDLTGKAKLPTASESKGLGTGEMDLAAQVDVYKLMAPQITGLATLGYTMLGDPPGVELRNVFYGSLGAIRQIDNRTSFGGTFDFRQRTSQFGDPQRELVGFVSYRANAGWRVQSYVVKGLANGSPDWGIGAVVLRQY